MYIILGIVLLVVSYILIFVLASLARRQVIWRIILGILVIAAFLGGLFLLYSNMAQIPGVCPAAVECPACSAVVAPAAPAVQVPITPLVVIAACDPSTVPFADMGELNKYVVTTINGPAIYEWWTGGSNEGVQRVDVGQTVTIHSVAGHWWTLPNQQGLDCAWKLHVENYAAKPQHVGKLYEQLVVPPPAEFLTK